MAIPLPDLLGRVKIDTSELDRLSGRIEKSLTNIGPSFSKMGATAGRALQSALEPVAVATGAFVGTALVKGFGRFTTIENSVAALTVTLGDAAKASQFLQGVLDIVTGTPFNLDQFVNAGKNLVAVGLDADRVLGKSGLLTTIGEIAASSGGGAAEVDQLVNAFAKVKTEGKLTGDTLRQLAQNGVPALAILQNHFGKTTDEMRKMVSEGAVPADLAIDVLSKGIIEGTNGIAGATVKLGGSMETLRETTTGAWGGMMAGIDRLGEAFFKGLTGIDKYGEGTNRLAKVMTGLTDIMDTRLKPVFESAGETVGKAFDRIEPALAKVGDLMDNVSDKGQGMGRILGPLTAAFAALGLQGIATALGPLGALIPAIGPIPAALLAMVVGSDTLRETLRELWDAIEPILYQLGEALLPAINDLIPVVERIAAVVGDALVEALETLTPDIVAVVEALAPLIVDVAEFAALLIEKLEPILGEIITAFVGLKTAAAISGVIDGVTTSVRLLFALMVAHPVGALLFALGLLALALYTAYNESESFRKIVDESFAAVKVIVATVVDFIIAALQEMVGFWFNTADQVLKAAEFMFSWIPGVDGLLAGARSAFDAFRGNIEGNLERAKSASESWKNKTISDFVAVSGGLQILPAVKSIEITAIDNASSTIRGINNTLNSITSKQVYVDVIRRDSTAGFGRAPAGHSGGLVSPHGIFHAGGLVQSFHAGGLKQDEMIAKLQVGEFVLQRSAAEALGIANLRRLNQAGTGSVLPSAPAVNHFDITVPITGSVDWEDRTQLSRIGHKVAEAIAVAVGSNE